MEGECDGRALRCGVGERHQHIPGLIFLGMPELALKLPQPQGTWDHFCALKRALRNKFSSF